LVHGIETLNAWFAPPASTPHVGGIVTICDDHFADAHGLTFHAPEGMSTESKASAVFVENITDSRLVEQIAAETGARVGGRLNSDALSGPDGPAATYLEMMHHNATTLVDALAK
jgi:zinc/manganese transport system substrate-binding protein